jgi:dihydrolipoamide dehydrogenase
LSGVFFFPGKPAAISESIMPDNFNLVILGGGPGGYACALKAAQLGLKAAVVEKRPTLGGTCLNVGCIPSKALLDSSEKFVEIAKLAKHGVLVEKPELDLAKMMARKNQIVDDLTKGIAFLFKKNKVASFTGIGKVTAAGKVTVTGADGKTTEVAGKAVVLATGSEPVSLPGIAMDGKHVVSSTEALAFDAVPKKLIVVGGGYIGLEMGSVWARLGAEVTVLEFLPRILPLSDAEMAGLAFKSLVKQGLKFNLDTRVSSITPKDGQAVVKAQTKGADATFSADKVLMSVGRRPVSANLGLEALGVAVDAKTGKVKVDKSFQTNVSGIYAIGDLIDGPMLAHKAQTDGEVLAEILAGRKASVSYDAVPSVVYIWPELASVGKTEEQLKDEQREYKVGRFAFAHLGRSKCMDETEGVVKVLSDAKTDRLLGVHIFGPRASDMIAEAVTVMEFSGSAEDVARTIHGHPTLSEAFGEAARQAAFGAALHA